MNKKELIKLLKQSNFKQLPKRGKGSHEVWIKDDIVLTIPLTKGSDYPIGTINSILKKAGLK